MKIRISKADELKDVLIESSVNTGAKRVRSLMSDDYTEVSFSLESPITLETGDVCAVLYDDATVEYFFLASPYSPKYNSTTGGFDYQVQFSKQYRLLQNKMLKYAPATGSQEVAFSLTASLDAHARMVVENIKQIGFTYNFTGKEYGCSIDVDTSESKYIQYSQTSVLDAVQSIADAFDTEWWFEDNVLHFGKCEFASDAVFEIGVNTESMTTDGNGNSFATRIIAFGSDRNLPTNYRPTAGTISVDGIVQKRLMLPEATGGYIDVYDKKTKSAISEEVAVFSGIYPRTNCTVTAVETYDIKDDDGNAITCYRVKLNDDFVFSADYILPGQTLMLKFNSGALNGMEFEVAFNPKGESENNAGAQLYELIRNESYGLYLPNASLLPKVGDTCTLYNWDATKIADLGLVAKAEQELLEEAKKYVEKKKIDASNYECVLYPSSCIDENGKAIKYSLGERVKLVNKGIWEDGRTSRIIGYEYPLDAPFDSPTYTVGESLSYSKFKDLQQQIDNITYDGKVFAGGGSSSGGGASVYVIAERDSTTWSDRNVLSSNRAKKEFLSATEDTTAKGNVVFDKGTTHKGAATFGDFVSGLTGKGGKIDEKGNGELNALTLRSFLEVPELRYKRTTCVQGDQIQSCASGVVKKVFQASKDTGFVYFKMEDGEADCFKENDLVFGVYHMESGNATETADDGKGNRTVQGFTTIYLRVMAATDDGMGVITYKLREGCTVHPVPGMTLVQRGNTEDEERQSFTYYGIHPKPYIRMLTGVKDWEYTDANIALQMGYMGNMPTEGKSTELKGHSAYLNNVYLTGIIKQLRENGETGDIPMYRGAFEEDGLYYEGDEVTYRGEIYICLKKNTGIFPDDAEYWRVVVEKGETGDKGEKGDKGADGRDVPTLTASSMCYTDTGGNGDKCYIIINGTKYGVAAPTNTLRGINLFVFDKSDFSLVYFKNYDTYGDYLLADEVAAKMDEYTDHIVVLIADDACACTQTLRDKIAAYGGKTEGVWTPLRYSWYFVGMAGLASGQGYETYYFGAVQQTCTIPLIPGKGFVLNGARGTDGANGKDGQDGKDGKQGLTGPVGRTGAWVMGEEYRNDEALTSGTRFVDTVVMTDGKGVVTGAYVCKKTHTATAANKPGSGSEWADCWEEMSSLGALYTAFLVAENAVIRFQSSNELVITGAGGEVEAGMAGTETDAYPEIWAGGERGAAAVGLYKDGTARFGHGVFVMNGEGGGAISGHTFTADGRDRYTAAPRETGMVFTTGGDTLEAMTTTTAATVTKTETVQEATISYSTAVPSKAHEIQTKSDAELFNVEGVGVFFLHYAALRVGVNAYTGDKADRTTATATVRAYVITYGKDGKETGRREIALPVKAQLPLHDDSVNYEMGSKEGVYLDFEMSGLYFTLEERERLSVRADLVAEMRADISDVTKKHSLLATAFVSVPSTITVTRPTLSGFASDGLLLKDGADRAFKLRASGSGDYIVEATQPLKMVAEVKPGAVTLQTKSVTAALSSTSEEWRKYALLDFSGVTANTANTLPTGVEDGYTIRATKGSNSKTVAMVSPDAANVPLYANGGSALSNGTFTFGMRRVVTFVYVGGAWLITY